MDRISDLPKHIIARVISLLETKEAIKTCILSSKWRYVWKGIPRIYLDGYESDPDNFVNLVKHVLKNCSSTKFLAFELYCPTDITRLRSLIQCIFSLNIEELTIYTMKPDEHDIYWPPKTPLPKSILFCTTLVVLKLDYFDIQIPDSIVCFPHLQSIDIGLMFPNFGGVKWLLRCCPVLKELFLFGFVDAPERLIIDISISTLKRLKLRLAFHTDFKEDQCHIIINTPNLNFLTIEDYSDTQYEVKDQPRLKNADIIYECCNGKYFCLKLLKGISATEGLFLSWQTLDALKLGILEYTWPTFPHLKRLTLDFILSYCWACFSKLLYSAPFLESLTLNLVSRKSKVPDSVPNCVSEHLKVIVLYSLRGIKDVVHVVEYFLSNAHVLKLMVIDYSWSMMDAEIVNKILMFPKASQACDIQFNPRLTQFKQRVPNYLMEWFVNA